MNGSNDDHNDTIVAAAAAVEPSARTVSPAAVATSQNGAAASPSVSDSQAQPLWSADPTVNAMAILLLQKGLKTSDATSSSNDNDNPDRDTLPSLLETLKARLQQEQKALAMITDDRTMSRSNCTPSNQQRHVHDSNHNPIVTCSDSSKQGETENESQSPSHQSSLKATSSQQDNAPGRTQNHDDNDHHASTKPTRRELLEALQQHMDILEKRGQVSNVIPGFLRRPREAQVAKRARGEGKEGTATAALDDDQISTSSTKAVQHGRKRQRQCTSKFQYYEDLATELLSNVIIPIPEWIYVPLGCYEDANALDTLTEGDTTEFTGDSTDLESFCSTNSSARKSNRQQNKA